MPDIIVAQRMWQRRDSAANWTSVNPVLQSGEIGVEQYTAPTPNKFKIGDGVTVWTLLPYAGGSVSDGDKGDIVISASGATYTIDTDVVTNAKLANVATATIKGRTTAGTGDPEDLTPAQARGVLNVADGATANATDAQLRDRTTHTGVQAQSTITNLTADLAAKADLVGGKVPTAQLPSFTFGETFTAANQAAMLALAAQMGDVAIRTDQANRKYLLLGAPAALTDWIALDASGLPVDSVNGYEGAVVLVKGDIGLGNVDNVSDVNKPISTATQTALNGKLGAGAKAADSELLDGLNSDRYWYGDGVNLTRDGGSSLDTAKPSGFYEYVPGSTGAPAAGWTWVINFRHSSTGNHYGFQLINSIGTTDYYLRYVDAGVWGSSIKLWHSGNTVLAANGGTGQNTYAIGNILYASTTTALSKLAAVEVGNVLISGGVGAAPSWNKVNLGGIASHVTGDLPVTHLNAGTGASATTFWRGDGKWATPSSGGYTVSSVSASYTETATSGEQVVLCTCGLAGITVTLPTAVGNTAKLTFKIVDNGGAITPLTLDGNGAQTIDGSATKTRSAQWSGYTIVSDNANWRIIGIF